MKKLLYLTGGLVLTVTTIVVGANMPKASAEETTQTTASVTVTSSCMLSATTDPKHEAEVVASTYRNEIGKTIISSTCNDINGYAIYAIGYTNTEWGRNDMLGQNTGRTIPTGTATSGDTSAWAMKLTAVTGTHTPTILNGFNIYKEVPAEYTKVASYNNSTTTANSSTPSELETTYAVYATGTQAPDTYVGKVKYTLVHSANSTETPCAGTYNIVYNANGGTGKMDFQTACANVSIGLLPNGFLPPTEDKQFAVWNTASDGSGHSYLPGQSPANLATIGDDVTLYALWAPKFMQDMTPAVCEAVAKDNPYRLYDRRDGKDYTVRYLKGACWMTQNLRVSGAVNSQYSNFSTYENFNPCQEDLTIGNSSQVARCHISDNELYGGYYNLPAATAGTVLSSNANTAEATEDICPSGWRLPNYTNNSTTPGSIDSLMGLEAAKFQAPGSSRYMNGKIDSGQYSYWWSTTPRGGYDQRYYLYSSSISSAISYDYYAEVYYGLSIRCVLKDS